MLAERSLRAPRIRAPRLAKATAIGPRVAALFDLREEAQRFMLGVIHRFHSDPPGLYRALAMKRAVIIQNSERQHVVIEAARFQGARRSARPVWLILIWNIDQVGVMFQRCLTRRDALARYRSMGTAKVLDPMK